MADKNFVVSNGFETAIKIENCNVRFDRVVASNFPTGVRLDNSKASIRDYEFNDVGRAIRVENGSAVQLGKEEAQESRRGGKQFRGHRFDE